MESNIFQIKEFRISNKMKDILKLPSELFFTNGNIVFSSQKDIQEFVFAFNNAIKKELLPKNTVYLDAGNLSIMALMLEIFHYIFARYIQSNAPEFFIEGYSFIEEKLKASNHSLSELLRFFLNNYSNIKLDITDDSTNKKTQSKYLSLDTKEGRAYILEEMFVLILLKENPAISRFSILFENDVLEKDASYQIFKSAMGEWSNKNAHFLDSALDIISFLKTCILASSENLKLQLEYIKNNWGKYIHAFDSTILIVESLVEEAWGKGGCGTHYSGDIYVPTFQKVQTDGPLFSKDENWMAETVLLAKNTYVYLYQLSKKYKRKISKLDEIPEEELENMEKAGINALWLIGLWERSIASAKIKQKCGNKEAIASAYSIREYKIASELGGDEALLKLKEKAGQHGIRLSADMVPNHTAIDSDEVINKPQFFLQTKTPPYPSYDFSGEDLSSDKDVSIYLERHYYSKEDCAVVFKRVNRKTKDEIYIYHGNDGTGMPWNDTAQLDFLKSEVREHVIEQIIKIAKTFQIIRFDAAMVLTQRHIRRLWYPANGSSDGIPSRIGKEMSDKDFYKCIPCEFWREVVDRVAKEVPDTLLLAEAFWMLEGYFVRSLGMHRVYNSAFMNMLKREENEKYRSTIKNTLLLDKEVLKRYVNFMSNPDEESAITQFGDGDKYFGCCKMMVLMPGLPMFSHGQFWGMKEKYGMEYKKAYLDEAGDEMLFERHQKEIFPLLKKRYLFSSVENFYFYDVVLDGLVNENVFAWSNRYENEATLIFYNNKYEECSGRIFSSCPARTSSKESESSTSLLDALNLHSGDEYYTIFYEFHSKLYYIRSNTELKDKGFFVILKGFECQLFIDIEEVKDELGLYKKLCKKLAGQGISNIDFGEKVKK